MAPEIKALIDTISAGIDWSPGWPNSFDTLTAESGIGCWKIKSNSNAGSTSTRAEWLSKVVVEIQTWALTPELRASYELAIDAVFGALFKRTASGGWLEEKLATEQTAYRSILNYDATIRDDYSIIS